MPDPIPAPSVVEKAARDLAGRGIPAAHARLHAEALAAAGLLRPDPRDLEALAAEQGVRPLVSARELESDDPHPAAEPIRGVSAEAEARTEWISDVQALLYGLVDKPHQDRYWRELYRLWAASGDPDIYGLGVDPEEGSWRNPVRQAQDEARRLRQKNEQLHAQLAARGRSRRG